MNTDLIFGIPIIVVSGVGALCAMYFIAKEFLMAFKDWKARRATRRRHKAI